MTTAPIGSPRPSDAPKFEITFPVGITGLDQDEEWFEYNTEDGERRRLRIHDYDELFSVPGLYEALVYDKLECRSPDELAEALRTSLARADTPTSALRVLDLGAGNGIVAEHLREIDASHIVGLDLLPEARMSAERDRPNVYDDYIVADLTDLSSEQAKQLRGHELNTLVTVAALGFGDIPPRAFAEAFNSITTPGWVGLTIKKDFLEQDDPTGFCAFFRDLVDRGVVEMVERRAYRHRLSVAGDPIFYEVVVVEKKRDIDPDRLDEVLARFEQA